MRSHRLAATVIGVAICLVVASCGTSGKSAGGLQPVASAPSAPPSAGLPSEPAPTTAATSTNNGGGGSGGGGGGGSTPVTVTVAVDPVDPVATADCPHTFTVTGTVSVDKGPATVKYGWKSTEAPPVLHTLHFTGHGKQSMPVTDQVPITGVNITGTDELQIDGHPGVKADASLKLFCGATAERPIPLDAHGTCPYPTRFTTNIHVIGPQTVHYEWRFSDGTSKTGDVTFTDPGASQTTVFAFVTVTPTGGTILARTFSAELKLSSPDSPDYAYTSPVGEARCDLVNR